MCFLGFVFPFYFPSSNERCSVCVRLVPSHDGGGSPRVFITKDRCVRGAKKKGNPQNPSTPPCLVGGEFFFLRIRSIIVATRAEERHTYTQ